MEILSSDQVPVLESRGFHKKECMIDSKESLPKVREEYQKFYDVAFVSLPGDKFALFVRGAIFSKEYLLSAGYQPWEGYVKGEIANTTELLDKLADIRGKVSWLVCEEDKKVYTKAI